MVRRVVTGQIDGKSVVLSDSEESGHSFAAVRGFRTTQIWATSPETALPHSGGDPVAAATTVMPAVNGTRLMIVQFPPDAAMADPEFDGAAAGAEYAAILPGLAECFEPDGSGFHITDSVDYDIILSGELSLEVDDGQTRVLKAGDIVVQNGTRHAWRNKSNAPAVMASILIGTQRKA
ncbi:cupin domain-containing protein [Burkholderia anthina]|uniref:Cupin domain-containing protein n=1 Tax=Burkholderia anthina TaxID=179879 RepID=A0A7T7AKR4_9BURK|nr:cupin domain-containing protein [Burkholderia anthina]MBY4869682.1 cupin domain-containing protein [Burkholderia anthina]QQK05922.1 cupin domain-containing protein [Burkholderia anthina]